MHFRPPTFTEAKSDAVHPWLIDTQDVARENVIDRYPSLLSSDEQNRMATFRSAQRQRQFLIARAALRTVLSLYLPEQAPQALQFTANEHGKPGLSANPGELQFNVSHSRHKIVIAVTTKRQVGVDIEYMDDMRDIIKIAEHYFHPREWRSEAFQKGVGRSAIARFYKLWTLKEAFIKAQGQGWTLSPSDFYFCENDALQPEIVITAPQSGPASAWQFTQQFVDTHFSMALVCENIASENAVRTELIRYVPLCGIPCSE